MGNSGSGYRFSTSQRDLRSDSTDAGRYPIANLLHRITIIVGTYPISSLMVVTMMILAILAGLLCYLEKRKQASRARSGDSVSYRHQFDSTEHQKSQIEPPNSSRHPTGSWLKQSPVGIAWVVQRSDNFRGDVCALAGGLGCDLEAEGNTITNIHWICIIRSIRELLDCA